MAVSPVRPSHPTQEGNPAARAVNRAHKGAAKDAATTESPQQAYAEGTPETPRAAATENHAGYEQGKRKESEHESKGTQVNIYA